MRHEPNKADRHTGPLVWLVTNIPTPYRVPLFSEISRQLGECGIRFKVIFGARGYARRRWVLDPKDFNFDYVFLNSRAFARGDNSALFLYGGLLRTLVRERPDAILIGGFTPSALKVWLATFLLRIPYGLWSGHIDLPHHTETSRLKRLLRGILVSRADRFVAYGSMARDYLVSIGAAREKVHIGINTVDTSFFREATVRARVPADDPPVLIYIGEITRRKRVDLLFRAGAELMRRNVNFRLQIIGDGPERDSLVALADALGLSHHVRFEGYRQKADIPAFLARATCFVFPTSFDIWGLVLVEAMAAGLPCLASVHAGATTDLIQNGVTGFAVDFEQTSRVADRIQWVIETPEAARRIGEAAAAYISSHVNLRVSAAGFVAAAQGCLERR